MAFIRRYGYNLPFSENVDGDPEENPPVIPGNPDAEKKKCHNAIRKQLRTVSFFCLTNFRAEVILYA
jgi:hypothetical protein